METKIYDGTKLCAKWTDLNRKECFNKYLENETEADTFRDWNLYSVVFFENGSVVNVTIPYGIQISRFPERYGASL